MTRRNHFKEMLKKDKTPQKRKKLNYEQKVKQKINVRHKRIEEGIKLKEKIYTTPPILKEYNKNILCDSKKIDVYEKYTKEIVDQNKTAQSLLRAVNSRYKEKYQEYQNEDKSDAFNIINRYCGDEENRDLIINKLCFHQLMQEEKINKNDLFNFMQLCMYINRYNGICVNNENFFLSCEEVRILLGLKAKDSTTKALTRLRNVGLLHYMQTNVFRRKNDSEMINTLNQNKEFVDIEKGKKNTEERVEYIITINPFVCFSGQFIDLDLLTFFSGTKWYLLNVNSKKIEEYTIKAYDFTSDEQNQKK